MPQRPPRKGPPPKPNKGKGNSGQPLLTSAQARLNRLKQASDVTFVGGWRQLQGWIRENGESFQPGILMWYDPRSDAPLYATLFNPEQPDAIATQLLNGAQEAIKPRSQAFTSKGGVSMPSEFPRVLPGTLIVTDESVVPTLSKFFEPLKVTVRYEPDNESLVELLDNLEEEVSKSLADEPPEPFSWDIPEEDYVPLFDVAEKLVELDSEWFEYDYTAPIEITLGDRGPQPGVNTLYAAFDPDDGEATFFFSREDFDNAIANTSDTPEISEEELVEFRESLQESGMPSEMVPAVGSEEELAMAQMFMAIRGPATEEEARKSLRHALSILFTDLDEVDPSYEEWLEKHGQIDRFDEWGQWPTFIRTMPEPPYTRVPDEREAQALSLGLQSLVAYHEHLMQLADTDKLQMNEPITLATTIDNVPIRITSTLAELEEDDEEEDDE
jgi:hypothetical protein